MFEMQMLLQFKQKLNDFLNGRCLDWQFSFISWVDNVIWPL